MRRIEIAGYGFAVLVAALACKSGEKASPGAGAAPTDDAKPKEKAIALKAKELIDEYKANEVRADAKFKGKRVMVVGVVSDIKKDLLDSIYVTLGGGGQMEFQQVQAFFDDKFAGRAAQLNKGDVLAIDCTCDGLMMNVLLKKCTIIEKDAKP